MLPIISEEYARKILAPLGLTHIGVVGVTLELRVNKRAKLVIERLPDGEEMQTTLAPLIEEYDVVPRASKAAKQATQDGDP